MLNLSFMIRFLTIILLFTYQNLYAEIDKNQYSNEEIYEKIGNFNWQFSVDDPIINDTDANAYIDLRNFPFVEYLLNYEEVQQFSYWVNGTESPKTKYMILIYPSNDQDNYDRISIYVNKYDKVGYIDGSDWVSLDPAEVLEDQWKREQKENKKKIENGYDPILSLEWYIKPTFNNKKGYVYQTLKLFYEDHVTYNTWIYLLGRDGYQFLNLAFDESKVKYVDEDFINLILDSYNFEEGKSYADFQEGDEVSSTTASDLVKTKEPELTMFIPESILCVDTINSVNKKEFDESEIAVILGVATGFNLYDYAIEGGSSYTFSAETLTQEVQDYCLANPADPFILAITKILYGQ